MKKVRKSIGLITWLIRILSVFVSQKTSSYQNSRTQITMAFTIFSNLIAFLRGQRGSNSFSENARKLFAELISTCDDNFGPIHIFSAKELVKATNNYSEVRIIRRCGHTTFYKGSVRKCPAIVMKFKDDTNLDPIKEIVFSSVFSSHSNVLTLLGCCLESKCPILVFENAENGTLHDNIVFSGGARNGRYLPWKCRVKIGMELCDAVAYLHNNFPNPIVHRDIKATNIFLDRHNSPKLFDFSLSMAIPDGDDEVWDAVRGTIGYLAPEYSTTGNFNEKIDVYGVGVVMIQLLTGKKVFDLSRLEMDEEVFLVDLFKQNLREGRFDEIVEPMIWEEEPRAEHLEEFAEIALRCLCKNAADRPAMVEVARRLGELYQTLDSPRYR